MQPNNPDGYLVGFGFRVSGLLLSDQLDRRTICVPSLVKGVAFAVFRGEYFYSNMK